jgi:hypothetical protein
MKRALITAAILSIIAIPAFASPNKHHSAATSKSLGYASEPMDRKGTFEFYGTGNTSVPGIGVEKDDSRTLTSR